VSDTVDARHHLTGSGTL